MTTEGPRRILIRCDQAPVPSWLGEQQWDVKRFINTRGDHANLSLDIEILAGLVLTRVGPRAADLVRIAAYCYRADTLVNRTGTNDASDDLWERHFALCIPVIDLEYWTDSEVQERLRATLRFGTDDRWEFAFSAAPIEASQIPLTLDPTELYDAPTSVVLFSGGADSLCVLLEAIRKGERPVAVSQWSNDTHAWRQKALLTEIRRRFRGWTVPQIGFRIHGSRKEGAEQTQRTRGFLFACLGAVAAAEIGAERVLLGDNGPISVNLPISDEVVGARASRSTHPHFLERFNTLIEDMFDQRIVVENPLLTRTRPEALDVLRRTTCTDLLERTLSCSNWRGQPAATPHCGVCSQCIDRRFATIAAELEDHDPASRYEHDVFLEDLLNADARKMAVSYIRFAQRVHRMSEIDVLVRYGELIDAVSRHDRRAGATAEQLVALIKRHAQGVLRALRIMTKRHLNQLVEGTLPELCVLRIAFAGTSSHPQDMPVPTPTLTVVEARTEAVPQASPVTEATCVFDGDRWQFTFGGLTRSVENGVNIARVACLLDDPYHEFSPEALLATAHPPPRIERSEEEQAELTGLRLEMYGDGGMIFDPDSPAFIANGIRELLEEIADRHPALADHLAESITKDHARFAYKPRVETRWTVTPSSFLGRTTRVRVRTNRVRKPLQT